MRVRVAGNCQQSLTGKSRGRRHCEFIYILGQVVAIVDAAELNSALRGFCQGHSRASTLSEDAFIGDVVIVRLAAKILGRNFLQLFSRVHGDRMRGARHGMGRLAATGRAGPGQILPCVTPCDFTFFPRHAKQFGDHAMHVRPGLRFGLDHE